jgi:hypothetical protein
MDYVEQEASARAANRGMWQGRFVKPWEWRRGKRLRKSNCNWIKKTGCQIKGNINSKVDLSVIGNSSLQNVLAFFCPANVPVNKAISLVLIC